MKKTKIISMVMAAAMAASVSVTAFAADPTITQDTTPPEGTTNVKYTVEPGYVVTIPEEVKLVAKDVAATKTVKVDNGDGGNVIIPANKKIKVSITGAAYGDATAKTDFKVANTTDSSYTIDYTIDDKDAPTVDVITVNANDKGTKDLAFVRTTDGAVAGDYTGTITFTVALEGA